MHYVPPPAIWHVWDGHCHRPDDGGEIGMAVLDLADRYEYALTRCQQAVAAQVMAAFPANQVDKETEARWLKWQPAVKYAAGLRKSKGSADLRAMLAMTCSVSPAYLEDQHPEWLNCLNGTVDLRTGTLWKHRPADLLTYALPVAFRPEALWSCPQFTAMVNHVAGDVPDVARYIWQVLGYALLGDNREQQIFFLSGPTKSGKSQLLTIVRKILSALALDSGADLICYARHGRNARTENSVRGMRLITISETSARMHIEEGQLKRLTGEPEITVDQHYAKARIRTKVSFVIICSTNDMPSVGDLDDGVKERMAVIPCGATIPPEYRVKGYAEQILATEAEGILATLIWHAMEYLNAGRLDPPPDVEKATEYFRALQNAAARYASDMLDTGLSWDSVLTGHQLWKSVQDWAVKDAIPGRNRFYEMLELVPGIRRDTLHGQVVFRQVNWKKPVSTTGWP
jgi:putative DNA primase/helicase